ncbi:hypothetical protein ASF32_08775 [Methylobacterium sp. Leaf91]|nr:hypothetical protein ASF32_08775 [Methylobacterium sp. Leaf91]
MTCMTELIEMLGHPRSERSHELKQLSGNTPVIACLASILLRSLELLCPYSQSSMTGEAFI